MAEIFQPLVSVIVLNLNGGKIIGACLDHLLQQTYPNYEIIVVDNASTDNSLDVLDTYPAYGKFRIIKSPHNLGCPGGRNLGVSHARGGLVAFIDNDGFADPKWLEAATQPFQQDSSVGAVASVVFFNRNRAVLNGAGGTVNWQGYGGDHAYHEPVEFAHWPEEVLYPMGCGMVVRRTVLEQIGPWDEALLNYFDDAELGFRVWKFGYRVVVAAGALVYHEFNYSNQFVPGKRFLTEQGRIRTALKYFPLRRLPGWLVREMAHVARQAIYAGPQLGAWIWNLLHLASALHWRRKFPGEFKAFEKLISPHWGWFRFPVPIHTLYQPDMNHLGQTLVIDDSTSAQLNYGWYWPERDRFHSFRWGSAHASALFRLSHAPRRLLVTLKTRAPQQLRLIVRRWGERAPVWETALDDFKAYSQWNQFDLPCSLDSGDYELLLHSTATFKLGRRTVGVGVAQIEFQ